MEKRLKEKHEKWVAEHWSEDQIKSSDAIPGKPLNRWSAGLPEPYLSELNNQLFAIPDSYHHEIRRCVEMALAEQRHSYHPFDTSVRDFCAKASHAYIQTAFYLLADCAVDEEKGYWKRDRLLYRMMLYRFWYNQTGWGLTEDREHGDFDTLRWYVYGPHAHKGNPEQNQRIKDFLEAIRVERKNSWHSYEAYICEINTRGEVLADPPPEVRLHRFIGELEGSLTGSQRYALDGLGWFLSEERMREGRTFLSAFWALRYAIAHPKRSVGLVDHYPIRHSLRNPAVICVMDLVEKLQEKVPEANFQWEGPCTFTFLGFKDGPLPDANG
jgi:hypothetical protein